MKKLLSLLVLALALSACGNESNDDSVTSTDKEVLLGDMMGQGFCFFFEDPTATEEDVEAMLEETETYQALIENYPELENDVTGDQMDAYVAGLDAANAKEFVDTILSSMEANCPGLAKDFGLDEAVLKGSFGITSY